MCAGPFAKSKDQRGRYPRDMPATTGPTMRHGFNARDGEQRGTSLGIRAQRRRSPVNLRETTLRVSVCYEPRIKVVAA